VGAGTAGQSCLEGPVRRQGKPRRPAVAGASAVTVAFALSIALATPVALAWRQATAKERRSITSVARQAPHAGSSKVYVSHIRVSTVGPWASATVTIYFGKEPDSAVDILNYIHGAWHNAGVGTAGEWCVMPAKDQRNLRFSTSYHCT
jgi:hypothetical protein